MTKRTLMVAIVLFLTSFLTACSTQEKEGLNGQLLIWHSWEGAEREALQKSLDDFRELYPDVTIMEERFSMNTL